MYSIVPTRTLAALLFAVVAGGAWAQAAPAAGTPRYTGSSGPALVQALEAAKADLKLTASQQALWDQAEATSRDARAKGRALRQEEAASGAPAAVAAAQTTDQRSALRQGVHEAWQRVYASLDAGQRGVVDTAMRDARAQHKAARAGTDAASPK